MNIEGVECLDNSVRTTGINPGDLYMAKRNRPWQLLTCAKVHEDGFVIPVEIAYCFDLHECFRVVIEEGKEG